MLKPTKKYIIKDTKFNNSNIHGNNYSHYHPLTVPTLDHDTFVPKVLTRVANPPTNPV